MEVPVQVVLPPIKVGVTVIVAVIGDVVVLTAVKEGIAPLPDAARPIDGVELVHENVVPLGLVVVKLIAAVVDPLQTATRVG